MSERITCPNCQNDFEITEVMSAQVAATIRGELEAEFAAKTRRLAEDRDALAQQARKLAAREEEVDQRVREAVEQQRQEIARKARVEAQQAVAVEIKDRDAQLLEAKQQLKQAQEQELRLRKMQHDLEAREEQLKLEVARQLDEERKQISESVRKQTLDESNLKLAERDHKIEAMARQVQELQRRLEQGSQQTQGEVLELALETLLAEAFPTDVIDPVAKGVCGGDVVHKVIDNTGRECGAILWESKRTKKWSDKWLGKAIDDQQQARASCACIVTTAMPEAVDHFDQLNGVWVTSWTCARSVAVALRSVLIESAQSRAATDGQHSKMELVYSYLSGPEFRNRVRGLVEPYSEMQADLEAEKRAFNRQWNKRQKQLDRALASTMGLYGDLQGIVGCDLKEIEGMDVLALSDETDLDSFMGAAVARR